MKNNNHQILDFTTYLIYKDKHNRYWKLVPVENINIQLPFLIQPINYERYEEEKLLYLTRKVDHQ